MIESVWVTIKRFPRYEINKHGVIRNKRTGRIMKLQTDRRGRVYIQLYGQTVAVSRLVAEAFIGDIPEGMDVMFLDGDKSNVDATNLRICTRKENIRHAMNIGTFKPNDFGKERVKVKVIETGKVYASIRECARDIGCGESSISSCLYGFSKHSKGYHFERV